MLKNTPLTYVALGFITVSTNSDRAPLHERHEPLKVPLVDNASVVLKGLWIVCVELLQRVKYKTKGAQIDLKSDSLWVIVKGKLLKGKLCFLLNVLGSVQHGTVFFVCV